MVVRSQTTTFTVFGTIHTTIRITMDSRYPGGSQPPYHATTISIWGRARTLGSRWRMRPISTSSTTGARRHVHYLFRRLHDGRRRHNNVDCRVPVWLLRRYMGDLRTSAVTSLVIPPPAPARDGRNDRHQRAAGRHDRHRATPVAAIAPAPPTIETATTSVDSGQVDSSGSYVTNAGPMGWADLFGWRGSQDAFEFAANYGRDVSTDFSASYGRVSPPISRHSNAAMIPRSAGPRSTTSPSIWPMRAVRHRADQTSSTGARFIMLPGLHNIIA